MPPVPILDVYDVINILYAYIGTYYFIPSKYILGKNDVTFLTEIAARSIFYNGKTGGDYTNYLGQRISKSLLISFYSDRTKLNNYYLHIHVIIWKQNCNKT